MGFDLLEFERLSAQRSLKDFPGFLPSMQRNQQSPANSPSFLCFPKGNFRAISTARLNVSPRVHLRPIKVVVSDRPMRNSNLADGFALRCFQRLS
jgi:hypothetical protein